MDYTMWITLSGGLGLFIYGMKMMGDGLEKAAGRRLKRLLEILTENRFLGVLIGAVVTAIIQSSSATTVMVVGFVNASVMTLNQAIGVIMGANIGTTMTSLLVSLNLVGLAPILVFIGVIFIFFFKKKHLKSLGEILVGFGVLFMGMGLMSSSMEPLRHSETFRNILVRMTNPILGVLMGTLITVILHSSSASVGILQAVAAQGLISLGGGIYILFGMNIGSCIDALIASIGTSTNARRAAYIHLIIKVIGTSIFLIAIALGVPFVKWITNLSPDNPMSQVSNAHIAFNLVTAMVLFPFSNQIIKFSEKMVKAKKDDEQEKRLMYLDRRILETPSIAVGQVLKEVTRMAEYALKNVAMAMKAFFDLNEEVIEKVYENEDIINYLNTEITHYLVLCNGLDLPERDIMLISGLYHVVNDIERIGDHAENLVEYTEYSIENNLSFTDIAKADLKEMTEKIVVMLVDTVKAFNDRDVSLSRKVLEEEKEINDIRDRLRSSHIERLNAQKCSANSGVIFLDIVTNLERVADHATNIVQSVIDDEKPISYMDF